MKRRAWLLSAAGAAGALVVGWSVLPQRSRLGRADPLAPADGHVALNGWISVAPGGAVQLAMNRSEMGQGVHTALAMLVAEELELPLAQVQLIPAGHDTIYGNVATMTALLPLHPRNREPGAETVTVRASRWMLGKVVRELGINITGGSSSISDAWEVLPLAAATARAQLLGAASLRWKLPVDELSLVDGSVRHAASSLQAHFGELAKAAAATPPGEVRLKPREAWKLVGTPAPRIDDTAKLNGTARYGIDVRPAGLVFAAVRHSPMLGGSPGRVEVDRALALPGVERVVRLGNYAGSTPAVAVVGRTSWHAQRGAQALQIDWQPPPAGTLDSATIARALEAQARAAADTDGGFAFHTRGEVSAAFASAARRIESVYSAPYLAHVPMEPMNCTAQVSEGRVTVWAPTQVPGLARALAARVAEVDESAVTVHVTYLGGGFGRRLETDVVGQAVRVALEAGGRPVQLLWSREEDIGHDFYRPAAAAVMRAALDAQGQPIGLHFTSAGDALTPTYTTRNLPLLASRLELPDKLAAEGLFDLPYGVPNQRIAHQATHHRVPIGYWRSVGHSHNGFFSESFIDELAHAARQDPVAFRLSLLRDMPRHAAVLRLAAEKAGWDRPLPAGRARGVALLESYGSIVAQVVEASVDSAGGSAGGSPARPRVHRVVCAADVGTVVNPGIVAQQMESAVIFGLSAALHGRIDIVRSVVQQRNFPDLPALTLAQTPRIETHLVPSTRAPAGAGEIGLPPVAPALANALFALTGKRLRHLPLDLQAAPG